MNKTNDSIERSINDISDNFMDKEIRVANKHEGMLNLMSN